MQKELITLFSRVSFPTNTDFDPVSSRYISMFNLEIASFGYTLGPDVIENLRRLPISDFTKVRSSLHSLLGELSGARANHAVLFKNFPYGTPDHYDHFVRKVIGYLQNLTGYIPDDITVLSCGHAIDSKLFPNLQEFGACPICEQQVDELDGSDTHAVHEFKSSTPLKVLGFADEEFLCEKGNALLSRNSSLSQTEKDFLNKLRNRVELDVPATVFKENLPFVYSLLGNAETVKPHLSGATDVMRIAYFMSSEDADLSLKENVRFKFTTKQKKDLLRMLESLDGLEEDLMRNRERWLRIGERVNPGSEKNRKRFPKTAAAFDMIRNNQEAVLTFNRLVEMKVRSKTVDMELLSALVKRPGEFLRRLDFLLRTSTDATLVLIALRDAARGAPTKLLFEVMKYLEYRKTAPTERIFIPKGKVNKMQIVQDKREPIHHQTLDAAVTTILFEMINRLSKLPPMGNVYIDPALRGILAPYNKRGDSATNVSLIKGSKYTLTASEVVRLFVHWVGGHDVDLSMIAYDADFNVEDTVSFTHLHSDGIVHSGDIRSAPKGASEFIDFDVERLRKRGIRYVAASIISYSGETFAEFPCFAGFMERDAPRSGLKYEPESVKLKFDLNSDTTSYLPLVFDLETMEVTFADLSSGSRSYGHVGSENVKWAAQARSVVNLTNAKPTIYDLLEAHVISRGTVVHTPEEADIVYSLDGLDAEALATELLG